MKPCLKHILALPEEFQDKLVKKVETLMRVGASQQDANRAALSALIDEAIDEMEAIETALREQHPDLFVAKRGGGEAQAAAGDGVRFSREAGYEFATDPDVLAWLRGTQAGVGNAGEVGVVYDAPIKPLQMTALKSGVQGFSKFTGISRIAARHAMRDHPEITPAVLAEALASLQTPRLIIDSGLKEDGRHSMVLVTPVNVTAGGVEKPVLVAINSGKGATAGASLALVATSYGKDSSAAWVARQIKEGRVLYADEKELGRLARSLRALQLPSSQRGNLPGGKVGQVPFSVLTSSNLGKFIAGEKGWNKGAVVQPSRDAADLRPGAKFSRNNFDLPEFGFISKSQQALQDRYNRWKQAVDSVKAQGGTITEANDFYMAEERYWGQVATRNDEFGKEIEKFVEAVKADGLELSDVALYAYAKHARERNQHIAKQRESMPDGGSGMTNEAADEILTNAEEAGLSEALEQHTQALYDWIDGTRDVLEKGGLISPDQRQAWDNTFRHYVPLRGREDLPEKKRIGAGFNIKGKEGFKAMGRKSEAKQIIEQIIQDRTRAYIRVGKNEVLRSFLGFVLDNPSPNLWQINAVESKPKEGVDANGDPIIEEGQKLVADDRTVTVKDGGEEIHILIKDDALREQMQNLHVEQMPAVLASLQWANRKIGAMLTSYNPVFVALNGMRDFQAASMGMLQEAGFKGAGQFLASYSGAMKDAAMAEILGKPTPEYLEYKRAGGTTGYFGLHELGQTEKDLMALAKDAERGAANPIKLAKAVAARVNDINAAVEQATRFAAYKAARKSGMSIAKAASVSKNITVNFNRKGTMSNSLGALILFFNPAVQGTARLAQALASKRVMATLGAGTTALFFLALANAEFGGDDDDGTAFWDKVPKEVKERNIVIMRRPKRNERGTLEADYFKIPMAYGYNVFAAVANELADQYRHSADPARGRRPIESAKNVAQALLGATIPANGVAQSLDTPASLVMVPFANAVGPLAQGALNVSSFGRPLHPDSPNEKDLPDSTKYSPGQAGTVFQKVSEKLNALTGGSKYEKGLIDVSPGAMENAMRFWGGGLTSFALDLGNAFYARQHIERPEPDLRRLPFVKQLYGRIDDETDRWFGYDKLNEAEKAIQPMDSARRDGNSEAMDEIEKKYGSLAWSGAQVRAIREELSRLRKEERRVVADESLSDSERYVQLVEIGGRVRQTLQRWNEAFNEAAREKPAQ